MSHTCVFKNCFNRRSAGCKMVFFCLPGSDSDQRRAWIDNSGNAELQTCKLNAQRLICEKHFEEKDIRRQFNRATLRRGAVPLPWYAANETTATPGPQTEAEEVYVLDSEETQIEILDEPVLNAISYVVEESENEQNEKEKEEVRFVEVMDSAVQTDEVPTVERIDQSIQTDPEVPVPSEQPKPEPVKQKLDEDEFFSLNVVAPLIRKLSAGKKAKAKMEILGLLFRIEQDSE